MNYGLIEYAALEYAGRSGRLLAAIEIALCLLEYGDAEKAQERLRKALEEEEDK